MNFVLPTQSEWIWKTWDDSNEWVLFDPRSGQTHLLDHLSSAVLRQVTTTPQAPEQLAEELVREFELEPEARFDAVRYVASLLPRLADLGLIDESGT